LRYAVALVLLAAGSALLGCSTPANSTGDGNGPSPGASLTGPSSGSSTVARWEVRREGVVPDWLGDLKIMEQVSSLIVVGKIVQLPSAHWNTPGGVQPEGGPLSAYVPYGPVVYSTYLVQPTQYLKGSSDFGEPIPFATEGGTVQDEKGIPVDYALNELPAAGEGSIVLVFLRRMDQRFGPTEQKAYWLTNGPYSLFTEDDKGRFVRNLEQGVRIDYTSVADVQDIIAAAPPSPTP